MRNLCVKLTLCLCLTAQAFLWSPAAAPASAEPADAADFTLQDIEGVRFYTLSSYRGKQPVLLFFWTTWCPFCQKALKSLSMTYDELRCEGLEILAVNLGESSSKVKHAVRYYNLPFTVLLDERSSSVRNYNLLGVPTYLLIDKEGKIIFRDNYLPKGKLQELLKDA